MPKLKTSRGAAKRFSLTGSGKVKRKKAYLRHILTNKATKAKRNLRQGAIVAAVDQARVKRLIPYL
ncbi:MAG: 50S ribosomal protein L35 [Nitrospinota bacterium]|nr:50S ribosomal protein L35 [Nitrospinota bacterium]